MRVCKQKMRLCVNIMHLPLTHSAFEELLYLIYAACRSQRPTIKKLLTHIIFCSSLFPLPFSPVVVQSSCISFFCIIMTSIWLLSSFLLYFIFRSNTQTWKTAWLVGWLSSTRFCCCCCRSFFFCKYCKYPKSCDKIS